MRFYGLLFVCTALATLLPKAEGLSYSPEAFLSWEEVVANSDFVGVIECLHAGAQVSEFVVVSSWKGTIAEPSLRLQWPSRVGDRFLACLLPRPPGGTPSLDNLNFLLQPIGGMEGRLGLWPEEAPNYRQADPIGWSIFPLEPETAGEAGSTTRYSPGTETSFETMKSRTQAVVESSGGARDALLIASALRYLLEDHAPSDLAFQASGPNPTHRDAGNLDDLLAVVLDPDTGIDRQRIAWALGRAGREETLARLEDWTYEREENKTWLAHIIIKLRHYESARNTKQVPWKPQPMRDDMSTREAKGALKIAQKKQKDFSQDLFEPWCEAFEVMTTRKPHYVAKYLRNFDPSVFYDEMAGQNLAVWYATRVREDRSRCFQTLATAEHPGIALAGAAFLLHEDPERGTHALEAFVKKDGPLRIQAAQLLVAHGNKDFVSVMLEYRHTTTGPQRTWGMRQAAMATLSNAAHNANVPQPGEPHWANRSEETETPMISSWWQTYGPTLTLDPLPVHWPPTPPTE